MEFEPKSAGGSGRVRTYDQSVMRAKPNLNLMKSMNLVLIDLNLNKDF